MLALLQRRHRTEQLSRRGLQRAQQPIVLANELHLRDAVLIIGSFDDGDRVFEVHYVQPLWRGVILGQEQR